MLFDEDKKPVSFIDELKIIREIVDELQKDTPHFDFKLILTGLKIIPQHAHIKKILNHLEQSTKLEDSRLRELVTGFDMVNEEDFSD